MAVKKIDTQEALRLHREDICWLDVRSIPEFEAGHVPGAYNIPLLHAGPGGMQPNPEFVDVVQRSLGRDRPLLVACKAGARSARAAAILEQLGYRTIYDYAGGWSGNGADPGWVAAGGPTTTTPAEGRTYAELARASSGGAAGTP